MSFTFYATCDPDILPAKCGQFVPSDASLLFPASAYKRSWPTFHNPKIPQTVCSVAADCGGYVATKFWGDYRYTPQQYVDWLYSWSRLPDWAATMDYCCENEITTGNAGIVRLRQQKTTENAYLFWNTFRFAPWIWVPTVQGWHPSEYERHALELKPLIDEMSQHYRSNGLRFRVGVGTLCARASVAQIHEVVQTVSGALPGIGLHLWGVKLAAIQSELGLPAEVISVDSAAWNGLFKRTMRDWQTTGMRKTEWSWRVAFPAYAAKVNRAIGSRQAFQMALFR